MAALAYPFWFVVFPMVYVTPDKRHQPFLRFHAYQGAALGLFGVVGLSTLRMVLSVLFRWMILIDVLLYPLLKLCEYGLLAAMVYGAFTALRGSTASIPFISDFVKSLYEEPEGES